MTHSNDNNQPRYQSHYPTETQAEKEAHIAKLEEALEGLKQMMHEKYMRDNVAALEDPVTLADEVADECLPLMQVAEPELPVQFAAVCIATAVDGLKPGHHEYEYRAAMVEAVGNIDRAWFDRAVEASKRLFTQAMKYRLASLKLQPPH
jgi:hypothetical protein